MTTTEARKAVKAAAKSIGCCAYEYSGEKYVTYYGKVVYRLIGAGRPMVWKLDLDLITPKNIGTVTIHDDENELGLPL